MEPLLPVINRCSSLPLGLTLVCVFFSQGVVSGILLVTSNKIFFDPCKTHPLVKEHGCEEYLLSCSVDNLTSISFFSDISHVHFSTSLQRSAVLRSSRTHTRAPRRLALTRIFYFLCFIRKKGKKILQQLKKQARGLLKQKETSAPSELPGLAPSLTREVSGEEEAADSRDMEEAEGELDGVPSNTATFCSGGQGAASTQQTVETKPSETGSKNGKWGDYYCGFLSLPLPRGNFWLSVYSQRSEGCLPAAPAV